MEKTEGNTPSGSDIARTQTRSHAAGSKPPRDLGELSGLTDAEALEVGKFALFILNITPDRNFGRTLMGHRLSMCINSLKAVRPEASPMKGQRNEEDGSSGGQIPGFYSLGSLVLKEDER